MRIGLRSILWAVVLAVVLVGLWYQTFQLTGVMAGSAPPGGPAPPAAPALAPLPMDQANLELFGRAHPVWSAFSS